MDNTVTFAEPRKMPDLRSRIKRVFGLVALVCTTLGACYLGGYLHGRVGLSHLRSQLESERQAARSNQERLSKQLDTEQQLSLTLDARRNLDQAITALDARNFGIAEQQVKKAARLLVAARAEGRIAELVKTFETFRLVATEDLGPQRKQLVEWVNQLDQMIVVPQSLKNGEPP